MHKFGRNIGILGMCAALAVLPAAGVLAQEPESTLDGVFTEEQAERGAEAYAATCSGCHGPDLRATNSNAPDLRDFYFGINWAGKTVGEKFTRIQTTMPPGGARSLPAETYVDIVAHILAFNGMPAGENELPADEAFLGGILIEEAE